jgi:hypothetical protein
MWWYILQNALLSICIIVILQYIWDYLKTNYTVRKTKHIVDSQTQKYRDIISEIQNTTQTRDIQSADPSLEYISEKDKEQMIRELTDFLHSGEY